MKALKLLHSKIEWLPALLLMPVLLILPFPMGAVSAHSATTTFANSCGDGRVDKVLDAFKDPSPWAGLPYLDRNLPSVGITKTGQGCSGAALTIDYDLRGGDWFVIYRNFTPSLNLSEYTHLRLALKGSNSKAHHNFQIKLQDANSRIYWVIAQSITDLPEWRVAYFDLRELHCFDDASGCTAPLPFDFSAVTQFQIGIARCLRSPGEECESDSEDDNTLFLDEMAAVDLRPGAKNRLVEEKFAAVTPDAKVRRKTAQALLSKQDETDLLPAWFEEDPPNYNTYSEALSLLVFTREYLHTKDNAYKKAANRLAARLISLQIPRGKSNFGAWYTAYKRDGAGLVPFDSSCSGNELESWDVDRCSWAGNTAWAVIALNELRNSGIYAKPAQLSTAIKNAGSWIVKRMGRIPEYPNLITVGMEGNISSYFGLLAAENNLKAKKLGNTIYRYGWDTREKRMKIGAGPHDYATAMDTAGSWGVTFLRSMGKKREALLSQAYAASTLRTASFDSDNRAGAIVYGYGDIAGPWTTTVEFGAQGAAAGILKANYVMNQIHALQAPDGSFPGSSDDWFGGTVPPWTTTMTGVASTAWVYFAHTGDPLLALTYSRTGLNESDQ